MERQKTKVMRKQLTNQESGLNVGESQPVTKPT
jgi:hypothetical protein